MNTKQYLFVECYSHLGLYITAVCRVSFIHLNIKILIIKKSSVFLVHLTEIDIWVTGSRTENRDDEEAQKRQMRKVPKLHALNRACSCKCKMAFASKAALEILEQWWCNKLVIFLLGDLRGDEWIVQLWCRAHFHYHPKIVSSLVRKCDYLASYCIVREKSVAQCKHWRKQNII